MSTKTGRANRSLLRKLALFVCAASIVGTLAGVAHSQISVCYDTNSTNTTDIGTCVQGAVSCLQGCLSLCRANKLTLNSLCVQNCVNGFAYQQGNCVGRFNTTIP